MNPQHLYNKSTRYANAATLTALTALFWSTLSSVWIWFALVCAAQELIALFLIIKAGRFKAIADGLYKEPET